MNRYALYSLYAGGVLHLGWAVFHLLFPRLFKWGERLALLDPVNRGIMRIMNLCLVFYFFSAGYLCLAMGPEILGSPLGRKLVAMFTAFWLLRLGLQFRFFRATHPVSLLLTLLFVITTAAYAYPLLHAAR